MAAIAQALSTKNSLPLPWKTVCDAINGALRANYLELEGTWPCEVAAAAQVTLREKQNPEPTKTKQPGTGETITPPLKTTIRSAEAELQIYEIQNLAEAVSELSELSAAAQIPLRFFMQICIGDEQTKPSNEHIEKINAVLMNIKEGWRIDQ